jgi:hypothetical protein
MAQTRQGLDDEDKTKVLFLNVIANANLPWPVEGGLRHLCPLAQPLDEL